MNRGNRGISSLEAAVCAVVVLVVIAVVAPAYIMTHPRPQASNCQSNLKIIGNAVKMYLADYNDTFPTNRLWAAGHKPRPVVSRVRLSTPGKIDKAGNPVRFEFGPNWVEGLQPYVESTTKASDPMEIWKCQAASDARYPTGSRTAAATYAFNRNLIEHSEGVVRGAANLMMAREVDRLIDAELRPTNRSTGPGHPPISPFLTERDRHYGQTKDWTHANGSNILFADGHIKMFDKRYFTDKPVWDPEAGQWFNFVYKGTTDPARKTLDRSIVITP